ncbi:MAG: protein kinase domain-containing protein [Cellulosilyticaceae bacterium]
MISEWFVKDKLYLIGDEIASYKVKKLLGEGRYGIAYLGENTMGNRVVIKQLKRGMLKKSKEKIKYEQCILKQLGKIGDSRFPSYIGKFKNDESEGYILEYKAGKTFERMIYEEQYVFSREEIYEIAFELIDMIKVLYDQHIIHKDIRVANVLFHPIHGISLIDFGLARYIDEEHYQATEDYWYLADFLIHLYYTSYKDKKVISMPWYKELYLMDDERTFLKKLMGIEKKYASIEEVEGALQKLQMTCFLG